MKDCCCKKHCLFRILDIFESFCDFCTNRETETRLYQKRQNKDFASVPVRYRSMLHFWTPLSEVKANQPALTEFNTIKDNNVLTDDNIQEHDGAKR